MRTYEAFFNQLKSVGIQLNELQKQAVTHQGGPLVVFAGPGSGKTTVLTCRASYLMQVVQIEPRHLLIVTFTKAAAREMSDRLASLPGMDAIRAQSARIGTFHSVFLRILLQVMGSVPKLLEDREQRQVLRQLLLAAGKEGSPEETAELTAKIGLCKNKLIMPQQIRAKKQENIEFKKIFEQYEEWKQEHHRWDYDDIQVACYRLLAERPDVRNEYAGRYRHILVDEFQDTNLVQYAILKMLSTKAELTLVGDDDQSIYRFRGAEVDYLLSFEQQHRATKIVLATNYRSAEPIIATAKASINHNQKREPKHYTGINRSGERPLLITPSDEHREAVEIAKRIDRMLQNGDSSRNIAVLYRTNLQGQAVVEQLALRSIPFSLQESEDQFYRRWQVHDLVCYFKLACNLSDWDSFKQIVNRPNRFINETGLQTWLVSPTQNTDLAQLSKSPLVPRQPRHKLQELTWDLKKITGMSPQEALRFVRKKIGYDRYLESFVAQTGQNRQTVFEPVELLEQIVRPFGSVADFLAHVEKLRSAIDQAGGTDNGVQFMTFHRAKGLEFKTVFLVGVVNGIVPHNKSLSAKHGMEALEEERRLFYVGLTRAKDRLILSAPKQYRGEKVKQSPFLKEIADTIRLAEVGP